MLAICLFFNLQSVATQLPAMSLRSPKWSLCAHMVITTITFIFPNDIFTAVHSVIRHGHYVKPCSVNEKVRYIILYLFINEITTFFMITNKRAKISSLNFLCIGIMGLWLHLYKRVFMTSLMRSQGRSDFEIDISPLIFELQRRSKAQNVRNIHGYIAVIFNFLYDIR